MYINDSPIKSAKDDVLGRAEFAKSLGKEIAEWSDRDSIVIGLYGPWGAGKSSIINIAVEEIRSRKRGKKSPIIFSFNPWNYSDQEKLVVTFLQELGKAISYYDSSKDAKKVGKELIAYSKLFLPLAIVPPLTGLSLLFNRIFATIGEFVSAWGELKEKPIDEFKTTIGDYIKKLDRRIIIIIDDIDRLNKKEIRQVFQLVKQNANFSNVVYLLPFDHQKVAEAMDEESFPGKSYVEKIVQIPFNIPMLEVVKLRRVLLNELDKLVKPLPDKDWDDKYWGNIYHDGLKQFFSSLRQVKRFVNSLQFNFARITNDVNLIDFIVLETIRVFCPRTYEMLAKNKAVLTDTESMVIGIDRSSEKSEKQAKIKAIFDSAEPEYKDQTMRVLKRLFPQIGDRSSYGHDWQVEWGKAKRVCAKDRFDRYFLLGVPEGEVSQSGIDSFVGISNSSRTVSSQFDKLIEKGCARDFLEKLYLYVDLIPEGNITSFLIGIYNSINRLQDDRFSDPFSDVYSWCNRLGYHSLKRISDKKKRCDLILDLIDKVVDLEVLSRFVSLEIRREEDSKSDLEKKLLNIGDLPSVKSRLKKRFNKETKLDSFLRSRNLAYMLYLWAYLTDDKTVSKYLKQKMTTLKGALVVIKGFTWSQSSISVGDYVGSNTLKVNLESMKKFIDVDGLRSQIEKEDPSKISRLSDKDQKAIRLFLDSFSDNNED